MEHPVKPKFEAPSETVECAAFWQWAQTIPMLRDYLYKIVNEGKRSPILGKRLKNVGLRRGIPDYHFPVPNKKYAGLWIEMKIRSKKEYQISTHQKEWLDKLNRINHYATFAFGWEEAAKITLDYLNNKL